MKPALDGLTCETVSDAAGRRAEASLVPTFEGKELDAKDLPEIQAEIRFIGDMQRLQVKPGDVFVLNVAEELTDEMVVRLRKNLLLVFGNEAKVLVINRGMTLGVMGVSIDKPSVAAGGVASPGDLLQSK